MAAARDCLDGKSKHREAIVRYSASTLSSVWGEVVVGKFLAAAFVLFACATAAQSSGYDDFSKGINANNRNDATAAIASFSAALAAADLAKAYVPSAYFGRAVAYLKESKCAEALSDVDAGIKLRPDDVEALLTRINANLCLKRSDAAQADFDATVGHKPDAGDLESFASLVWHHGLFAQAAANYAKAFNLAKTDDSYRPYIVLWYAMSAARAGALDQAALSSFRSKLGSNDWPVPLIDYYLGKATLEDVKRAADSLSAKKANNQECEADFYIAEWHLAQNNPGAALLLLKAAEAECPHNYVEYNFTEAELKRQSAVTPEKGP